MGISSSPKFPCVSTGTPLTSTLMFLPSMPRILILPSLPIPPDLRTFTPDAELIALETLLLVFCNSAASIVETVSTCFAIAACSASDSVSTESKSSLVTSSELVEPPAAFTSEAPPLEASVALLSATGSSKSSNEVTSSSCA